MTAEKTVGQVTTFKLTLTCHYFLFFGTHNILCPVNIGTGRQRTTCASRLTSENLFTCIFYLLDFFYKKNCNFVIKVKILAHFILKEAVLQVMTCSFVIFLNFSLILTCITCHANEGRADRLTS